MKLGRRTFLAAVAAACIPLPRLKGSDDGLMYFAGDLPILEENLVVCEIVHRDFETVACVKPSDTMEVLRDRSDGLHPTMQPYRRSTRRSRPGSLASYRGARA